jgi:outer membrane immunogenic protein
MVPTLVLESVPLHHIHAVGSERLITEELKMKKLVLAVAAIAAFTGSALAADMAPRPYTKAPPPVVAPVANWTGCYVGGGGGYGMWNQENTPFLDATGIAIAPTSTTGGRGYFGTVQGGCDYQFAAAGQQFVIGAFGDYDFSSLKGQLEAGAGVGQEKMSSAWSGGGRVGWLAFPSLLTYFSAGYTEATFDRVNFNFVFPPFAPTGFFLDKATYHGYFIGAGDEYALNFLPGLFWKTEYRLSTFDHRANPFLSVATGLPTGASEDSKKWVQTVRSELVYRFNWGAPLVAKY